MVKGLPARSRPLHAEVGLWWCGVIAAAFALALGGCRREPASPAAPDAETPRSPAEVAEEAPPVPEAPEAFLVWRQDVGGVGVTTLVGGSHEPLVVSKLLLASHAEHLWSLSPLTERWALSPCGEAAAGTVKSLRAERLLPEADDGLPHRARVFGWSEPSARPAQGESVIHDEHLVFEGQVGPYLVLRHQRLFNTCPVPAGEPEPEVTRQVFDLRDGALKPMSALESDPADDGGRPPPVAAWLKAQVAADGAREYVDPAEEGLYGGAGWSVVPKTLVQRVLTRLNAAASAPVPDGPTGWD